MVKILNQGSGIFIIRTNWLNAEMHKNALDKQELTRWVFHILSIYVDSKLLKLRNNMFACVWKTLMSCGSFMEERVLERLKMRKLVMMEYTVHIT